MLSKSKKTPPLKNEDKKDNVTPLPVAPARLIEQAINNFHRQMPRFPGVSQDVSLTDRLLHAAMGRVSGISPAAVGLAVADWMAHLALAPGRQAELARDAFEKSLLFAAYMRGQMTGHDGHSCCAESLPQDRRFQDPEWNQWPYNVYRHAYLLSEQWWQNATIVRGITRHHQSVLPFMARQMLDTVSPLNFPLTNPRLANAMKDEGGMNFVRGGQNLVDDWLRQITGEPAIGLENFRVGENIACTKGKVVYRNRLIELIQYTPLTTEVYAEPVLIVPAWIMKYYILDLSPENSLVGYLLEKGHTVFMISWKNPTAEDRDIGFEDYLRLGVTESLGVVNAVVPDRKIHAVGYCLGGTLLATAAAAMARDNDNRLKTVTLFATQVDFEEAGELLLFIDESQLSWMEDMMWEKGYLDSRSMAGTFQMLRSRDLVWSRIVENYLLGKRVMPNDLMAWNADTTRMPYKMHSEYLRSMFLNNDLSEGHFIVDHKPVALSDIHAHIFCVGTQRDHVAPWRSVYKIHLFTDTDVTFVLTSGGHNAGIVSEPAHPGRTYQIATRKEEGKYVSPDEWVAGTPVMSGSWWPEWQDWLAKHSGEKTTPPATGSKDKGYPPLCDAPGTYIFEK